MNKRLQKKKSNCKNLVLGSLAWTHVVNGSPVLSVFSQVWDENTVSVWKGYFDRKFKACDPKNDYRYRRATMFHYIDKNVRRYYNRAVNATLKYVYPVSDLTALAVNYYLENDPLVAKASTSCEGMYLDD